MELDLSCHVGHSPISFVQFSICIVLLYSSLSKLEIFQLDVFSGCPCWTENQVQHQVNRRSRVNRVIQENEATGLSSAE